MRVLDVISNGLGRLIDPVSIGVCISEDNASIALSAKRFSILSNTPSGQVFARDLSDSFMYSFMSMVRCSHFVNMLTDLYLSICTKTDPPSLFLRIFLRIIVNMAAWLPFASWHECWTFVKQLIHVL